MDHDVLSALKKHLVGTGLGQIVLDTADNLMLKFIPVRNPEMAAAKANHIIARRLLRGLCPPNGQFLDIGAHIGSVFSAVHRANPTICITAIEADPVKADDLKRRYGYAKIISCAVSEQKGTAEFFIYDAASGYNSLSPHQNATPARCIKVAVERLDELLAEDKPDFVKIDVEGAELGVLKGGEAMLARARPVIMFESIGRQINALGYEPGMIWDLLTEQGYQVLTPDRVAHDCASLSRDSFLEAHDYPFRTNDYFAIPQEKRASVRDRARQILGVRVE